MVSVEKRDSLSNALLAMTTTHLTLAAAVTGGMGALPEGGHFRRLAGLFIAAHMAPFIGGFLWLLVLFTSEPRRAEERTRRCLGASAYFLFVTAILEVLYVIVGIVVTSKVGNEGWWYGSSATVIVLGMWAIMVKYMFWDTTPLRSLLPFSNRRI